MKGQEQATRMYVCMYVFEQQASLRIVHVRVEGQCKGTVNGRTTKCCLPLARVFGLPFLSTKNSSARNNTPTAVVCVFVCVCVETTREGKGLRKREGERKKRDKHAKENPAFLE